MIHFIVKTSKNERVSIETMLNAAHAMGLVWGRHFEKTPITVRLSFEDYFRHPDQTEPLRSHALCDPKGSHIRFALRRLERSMGTDLPMEIAVIPSAAHEMMHLVQFHQGRDVRGSFDEQGNYRAEYQECLFEKEARLVGLDVLKSMQPGVSGHFIRQNGEIERIPESGSFKEAAPYYLHITPRTLRERLELTIARAKNDEYQRAFKLHRSPPPLAPPASATPLASR